MTKTFLANVKPAPFKWQEKILKNKNVEYIVCPRQNGKSEILAYQIVYAMLQGKRVFYSSIEVSNCRDTKGKVEQIFASSKVLAPFNCTSKNSGGSLATMCDGGGFVSYRARSKRAGIGGTYDLIIYDEFQNLDINEFSATIYTVATKKSKILFAGTSPRPIDNDIFFRQEREKFLGSKKWVEFGIGEIKLSNAKTLLEPQNRKMLFTEIERTNPSFDILIKKGNIEKEIEKTEPEDFLIQRLGLLYNPEVKFIFSSIDIENIFYKPAEKIKADNFTIGIRVTQEKAFITMCQKNTLQVLGIYDLADDFVKKIILKATYVVADGYANPIVAIAPKKITKLSQWDYIPALTTAILALKKGEVRIVEQERTKNELRYLRYEDRKKYKLVYYGNSQSYLFDSLALAYTEAKKYE